MIRQQPFANERFFAHEIPVHDASRVHVFQTSLNRDCEGGKRR